jgi:cobyrinic acid a,c-diamide synthase
MRRQDEITIPDRHLGLIPTEELPELSRVIDRLGYLGETCFNWEVLLPLLELPLLRQSSQESKVENRESNKINPSFSPIRLAIARDRAFSFYYADNLDLLQAAGFDLVEWSPIADRDLPENIHGLYFGGGFPEVFAPVLSDNEPGRQAVKSAIVAGIPTYAECGGLMYLCEHLLDFEAKSYPMVGILPTQARMGKRLTLGYRQATAQQSTPFMAAGETLWGHEFHRSYLATESEQPLFRMQNYDGTLQQTEGWQRFQLHASYLHLHLGGKPQVIQRWLGHCQSYQGRSH